MCLHCISEAKYHGLAQERASLQRRIAEKAMLHKLQAELAEVCILDVFWMHQQQQQQTHIDVACRRQDQSKRLRLEHAFLRERGMILFRLERVASQLSWVCSALQMQAVS